MMSTVPCRRASALGLLVTMAALAACTSGGPSLGSVGDGSVACAPGSASLGSCCGNVAMEVPASSLTIDPCQGSSAYALCDGFHFECEYVCTLPDGFTVLAAGMAGCPEGGAGDAKPEAPSDHPIPFDGGNLHLGPCSGDVVALIPASSCPDHCPGSVAYAVCDSGAYGACACNIPPGYTLVALSEGGAPDGGGDAPIVEAGEGGGGGG